MSFNRPQGKNPGRAHHARGVEILHEDRDILVVDKAAGLLTVATERDKTRTAYSFLMNYVRKGDPKSRKRVFIVHRLDQETSGVLVFAKSEEAKHALQEGWEEVEKHYLAVVSGVLAKKEDTLSSYLAENQVFRVFSTRDPSKGKLSRTTYRVLKEANGMSALWIHLLTGRKHQIRVQLSDIGHPVLGDSKYGKPGKSAPRLLLHAKKISFPHPVKKILLTFEAPTPSIFSQFIPGIE